ncbi:hypothetical protein FIM1_893 [Kluyveromyces marxianus]|uniref:Transmembrane protein n=1 Tax=Kluyveromyces marxianus TaxID=4911 RepID=A0ABX6EQK0_KLUMA|nr:hypothetical protein FIM1_893 [Kluyveromyces marxianus]
MVVVMREFLFSFVCAVLGVSCCGFSVGLQLCLLQCPDQRRSCNAGIKGGRDKFVRPLLFRTRLYSVVALFFFFFLFFFLFFIFFSSFSSFFFFFYFFFCFLSSSLLSPCVPFSCRARDNCARIFSLFADGRLRDGSQLGGCYEATGITELFLQEAGRLVTEKLWYYYRIGIGIGIVFVFVKYIHYIGRKRKRGRKRKSMIKR